MMPSATELAIDAFPFRRDRRSCQDSYRMVHGAVSGYPRASLRDRAQTFGELGRFGLFVSATALEEPSLFTPARQTASFVVYVGPWLLWFNLLESSAGRSSMARE